MGNPTELRARAAELESRVSPVIAGPRTDDERMWLEKATALRLEAAWREVQEGLVLLAAPLADQVRDLLKVAMEARDTETILREGNSWSGRIAPLILELGDRVDDARRAEQ
ncbi:hypothetical protein AB0O20_06160 [Streptomyces kronopolitis]|uniref:hypothetical protein n=1 Tax=Streptomyces kronopolitis TaxID=1612435 RepID=UPI00342BF3C3